MSLPVVLPGSCCPVAGLSMTSQHTDLSSRSRLRCLLAPAARPVPASISSSRTSTALLPGRPLLSLGFLQLVLGCSMLALSFGALSLSGSPQVRNSCPFWAGSSVILSGIIGLTTWRKPALLLVNLFILLSVVCVLLNLAGFVLCCQGAQLVSSIPGCQVVGHDEGKLCLCCEDFSVSNCTGKDNVLKLYLRHSCSSSHFLLKKVLFALCALNALTTTVCLMAAALRYLQIFATRRPSTDEGRVTTVEAEDQGHIPDPDDFVPPAPPPSYFSTFYSYSPRLNRRLLGSDVIPLPHIYGTRIKGIEVFCPMEPPPPYEAVAGQLNTEQNGAPRVTDLTELDETRGEPAASSEGRESPLSHLRLCFGHPENADTSKPKNKAPFRRLKKSKSEPILRNLVARAPLLSCEAATQTEWKHELGTVTLRRGGKARAGRSRPRSLIDYKSYRDTKLIVARFLEQSSCSLAPDVKELVENIKTVLKSDEEHMNEAVFSANVLEQVMTSSQPRTSKAHTLPFRKHPGLLHLESCGDLSTFTKDECRRVERREQRTQHERPHSLIEVVQETVL
ncbi:protein FAM189A2 isoform X2 [Protopterus annectens]|uniref:protein FAM189A2 isoform X2 n=1 Tax=Protopterus annectens TaxID=7888 RepID=UPI001CFA02FD|nr:protein FAM189A2 isoform X2 [Protopterus annectens]